MLDLPIPPKKSAIVAVHSEPRDQRPDRRDESHRPREVADSEGIHAALDGCQCSRVFTRQRCGELLRPWQYSVGGDSFVDDATLLGFGSTHLAATHHEIMCDGLRYFVRDEGGHAPCEWNLDVYRWKAEEPSILTHDAVVEGKGHERSTGIGVSVECGDGRERCGEQAREEGIDPRHERLLLEVAASVDLIEIQSGGPILVGTCHHEGLARTRLLNLVESAVPFADGDRTDTVFAVVERQRPDISGGRQIEFIHDCHATHGPGGVRNLTSMIRLGSNASITFVVDEASTAIALGSGDVPVLGTPKVVALCEEASVGAIDGLLELGATTVGTNISLDHTAPSAVGSTVMATATVISANDRSIEFTVEVTEADRTVAEGTHRRAIINRDQFLTKLSS